MPQLRSVDGEILMLLPARPDTPNIQGERREAAAADVRFVSEPSGCLPFAPTCGLGVAAPRSLTICQSLITRKSRWIQAVLKKKGPGSMLREIQPTRIGCRSLPDFQV